MIYVMKSVCLLTYFITWNLKVICNVIWNMNFNLNHNRNLKHILKHTMLANRDYNRFYNITWKNRVDELEDNHVKNGQNIKL